MSFDQAVDFVLRHEGGYVDHPKDPGGETNFGISKRAYPNLDIASLTIEQAKEIYFRDYYSKLPAGLPDRLANLVFDTAVNAGMSRAVRILQTAVGTYADGEWGPASQRALERHSEDEVLAKFCAERVMFYARLETFQTFGKGWVKRVLDGAIQLTR